VELIRTTYGIEPGEIDLCTFPLFALFAPALGMTAIIPDMDFTRPGRVNPERIVEIMEDFGPTNMFGGPALLDRVGHWCRDREIRFPTLRRVICAGAPVQPRTLRTFKPLLSGDAQVFSGYGATEARPLASIGSREILDDTCRGTDTGNGVCVGHPNKGIDLDVIEIRDDPIPEWSDSLKITRGAIGEIVVRGAVVTQSYFNRENATRAAKIFDPETGRHRHRMGDVGWIDNSGRLWFCGRKNHRVETRDGPMFTIPVESIFNTHPRVRRTALIGLGIPGEEIPVLCIERDITPEHSETPVSPHETTPAALVQELVDLGRKYPHTRPVRRFILHPGFPVDVRHNSKIFREKLRDWVQHHRQQIMEAAE